MRKFLSALAAGAFAVMLSAPAAHAVAPADAARQTHAQWDHPVNHDRDDDGRDCDDGCYRYHHRGLVGKLIAWLV